jgi:hypothetical protein
MAADPTCDLENIEKFSGEHFVLWKYQMKAMFRGKELYSIVDSSESLETIEGTKAEWRRRDSTAVSLLCRAVDRKHLGIILNCEHATKIWTKLIIIDEQRASENVHIL